MGATDGLAFGGGAAVAPFSLPFPVRAEPVEALHFFKKEKPFDRLRANGFWVIPPVSPSQEVQSQRFKPVLVLDHRPMATTREDV